MLKADREVTLKCGVQSNEHKHLQVQRYAILISEGKITLQGADYGSNSQYALYVENGGNAEIKDGVTITEFKNSWVNNGGYHAGKGPVFVDGTLTMTGGTIEKNTVDNLNGSLWFGGGGVYVGKNGQFTMKGGRITENEASGNIIDGGGVFVVGTFNMESGEITKNKADKGRGVVVGYDGTFNWFSGKITANEGPGDAVVSDIGGTFNNQSGNTAN